VRFLELLYRIGFFLVIKIKKIFGMHDCSPFKVISVGNLSVGGTGKSVFVQYLTKLFPKNSTAIFLRGYKSEIARSGQSFLVHKKNVGSCGAQLIGDEALMLARALGDPIVVGRNRKKSFEKLKKFCAASRQSNVQYILLDDGYQNMQLKKDCEILLLDGRSPFGNGRCLPVGRLREKDFSRASAIVLTHADKVDQVSLDATKAFLSENGFKERIFYGRHQLYEAIDCKSGKKIGLERVDDSLSGTFFAVAAIGSFSGFLSSLADSGFDIKGHEKYRDHFAYSHNDVASMLKKMRAARCDRIVTTEKDWQKLEPLVGNNKKFFFVVRVKFEFLSREQRSDFFRLLGRELGL